MFLFQRALEAVPAKTPEQKLQDALTRLSDNLKHLEEISKNPKTPQDKLEIGLIRLNTQLQELLQKAKENKLTPEDTKKIKTMFGD